MLVCIHSQFRWIVLNSMVLNPFYCTDHMSRMIISYSSYGSCSSEETTLGITHCNVYWMNLLSAGT